MFGIRLFFTITEMPVGVEGSVGRCIGFLGDLVRGVEGDPGCGGGGDFIREGVGGPFRVRDGDSGRGGGGGDFGGGGGGDVVGGGGGGGLGGWGLLLVALVSWILVGV